MIPQLRPKTVILLTGKRAFPTITMPQLWYEACFPSRTKQLPHQGEPYRPFKILYFELPTADCHPTFVVGTSPRNNAQRRKACSPSRSQPSKSEKKNQCAPCHRPAGDEMNQLARHYGQMIAVDFGEPFLQKELMKVDDVVKMEVRSVLRLEIFVF